MSVVEINDKPWSGMIENHIKQKLDYFKKEHAVVESAEKLISEKIGNVTQLLSELENNLYKLYN